MISKREAPIHLLRWYNFIQSMESVSSVLSSLPEEVSLALHVQRSGKESTEKTTANAKERQQEGKFVDLPGAEMGKVIVRFPPEASG